MSYHEKPVLRKSRSSKARPIILYSPKCWYRSRNCGNYIVGFRHRSASPIRAATYASHVRWIIILTFMMLLIGIHIILLYEQVKLDSPSFRFCAHLNPAQSSCKVFLRRVWNPALRYSAEQSYHRTFCSVGNFILCAALYCTVWLRSEVCAGLVYGSGNTNIRVFFETCATSLALGCHMVIQWRYGLDRLKWRHYGELRGIGKNMRWEKTRPKI